MRRTFGNAPMLLLAFAFTLFAISENWKVHGAGGGTCNPLHKYEQPYDVGINTKYDTAKDDGKICARDCNKYPKQRICYYEFTLEQYNVMGPACDACWNRTRPTDCLNPQCISADGVEKTVLVSNRRLPSPAIQVCYNDRIIVDIHNHMPAREIAMHWHGILQLKTPFMDGVPLVTQCAIPEGSKFRYDFLADTAGTRFYHSHSAFHEFEGLAGSLIVRTADKFTPHRKLYDYDLYSHVILLSDWMHVMEDDKYPGANRDPNLIITKADSYLLNGFGTFFDKKAKKYTPSPIAKFVVQQGKKYRFRIIAATSQVCAARFTIQSHPLKVISTDGYDVEPVTVRTIYLRAGELFDFVVDAKKPGKDDCYVIRVQGTDECKDAVQYGLLCYKGTAYKGIHYSNNANYYTKTTEKLFNSLKFPTCNEVRTGCIGGKNDKDSYCMDELRSISDPPKGILARDPDERYFFHLGSFVYSHDFLYNQNTYHRHFLPFGGPSVKGGVIVNDNMNNKSTMFPSSPLYTTEPPKSLLCPGACDFCECFSYFKVETNKIIEVVMIDDISDPSIGIEMDHPMHLHGHHFWVLKQGSRKELNDHPNDYFNRTNIQNCVGKCTKRPNHRDVVSVPAGGFAVVRWKANNTGTWAFHCHFVVHNHNGMSTVFQVGERKEFKPVPKDWPKCGDYAPDKKLGSCKPKK